MRKLVLSLVMLVASVLPAAASDHNNLDEDQPTELEDAYPTEFRNREIQGVLRFTEEGEKDRWLYQPVLEFGILPNTQFTLSSNLYSGNADKTGSGDVNAGILYNFNTESVWVPATAVAAKGEFPTGEKSRGVDYEIKLLMSKMPYVYTSLLHRLHVNLVYKHNSGRDRETERAEMFKGIFGFSMRACKDSVFVIDYVREMKREKHQDSNVLEAGFRRQLTPYTLISIGAGAGIGEESERYRITAGFQHSF